MGNSLIVEGIRVEADILESYFVCDLNACRGACCTLKSEVGAPVEPDEIAPIQNALPEILPFMTEEGRKEVVANGFIKTSNGKVFTPTLGGKACVFAKSDKGIAGCSMESAYLKGKTGFQKPVSCHLYPIRIQKHFFEGEERDWLYYQKHPACACGTVFGKAMKQPLYMFLEEALTRKYGEMWFQALDRVAKTRKRPK